MKKGDFVRISYTGRVKETGELFDTTHASIAKLEKAFSPRVIYAPQCIIVGEGRILKGLDDELLNMSVGEERKLELPPEKAFGKRSSKLVKLIPEAEFKRNNMTPYPGMLITLGNMQGRVMSASSGRIKVDFNHPLAGRTLVYEIKVESELKTEKEKIEGIIDYYAQDARTKIDEKKVEVDLKFELPENVKRMITDDINKHVKKAEVAFTAPKPAEKKTKSSEK